MCYELLVPQNYTALSGDLEVKLIGTQPRKITGRLHLLRASTDQTFVAIAAVPITNESSSVKFPCGVVALGGHYQIKFISNDISEEAEIVEAKPEELDVFWPVAHLSLDSKEDKTYPESPVKAILEFPDKKCEVAAGSVNPELWMELIYCGHSLTGCIENTSLSKVLYRRQVIGYPRLHELPLSCELFGLAGHYVLTLKTSLPNTVPVLRGEPPHLKLAVSDKFVFNVHARSILPCDSFSGGVAVLFQYPACEPRVDRVRLFAKLRADVASLAPPTTLHYVVEQRIPTGAHSLRFSCELFSERYVEYCFVYVNEAITGAVTDVRMDCVATLPVRGKSFISSILT
ncbi:hypothetical protein C0J52_22131 [Blattella germanica]|nr:hypothetical protein C0J52_22131 [Blattella germanica]